MLHFNHSHVLKLVFPPSPSLETASRPAGCAPVSPVGSPRLLWMQALLKGQRAAQEIQKDSCRLEGTLTCYTCQLSLVCAVISVTPKGINRLSPFPVSLGVRAEISLSAGSLWLFKLFGVFVKTSFGSKCCKYLWFFFTFF